MYKVGQVFLNTQYLNDNRQDGSNQYGIKDTMPESFSLVLTVLFFKEERVNAEEHDRVNDYKDIELWQVRRVLAVDTPDDDEREKETVLKEQVYDEASGLFYRDAKYIYPKHTTNTGKKDFWARGNGWVFAALARTLEGLPESDAHYEEFVNIFTKMAESLKNSQQKEGYWTRSMLDQEQAPGPETSGTAFCSNDCYDYMTCTLDWGNTECTITSASC